MAKRARRDPIDDLPKAVANEIMRERITAAQELGHAVCGHYVGDPVGSARWQICTLPPKHTEKHH
jgi:hypothetical protein